MKEAMFNVIIENMPDGGTFSTDWIISKHSVGRDGGLQEPVWHCSDGCRIAE